MRPRPRRTRLLLLLLQSLEIKAEADGSIRNNIIKRAEVYTQSQAFRAFRSKAPDYKYSCRIRCLLAAVCCLHVCRAKASSSLSTLLRTIPLLLYFGADKSAKTWSGCCCYSLFSILCKATRIQDRPCVTNMLRLIVLP